MKKSKQNTTKNNESKTNVNIEIVCVPTLDEKNNVACTKYELRITNENGSAKIPLNNKLPPEEIVNKLLELLDLTNTEITSVAANVSVPTSPIVVPVSTPVVPYEDPYKRYPWKPEIIWAKTTTSSNTTLKDELK